MQKLLALSLALALPACTPSTTSPPNSSRPATLAAQPRTSDPTVLLGILASTASPEQSRKTADARLVELKGKSDPARLAILEQLLYAKGHSDPMRIYAMDQLADADPARAANLLALYLPRFENEPLAHACTLAITLGDPRLLDPLIRSLARALSTDLANLTKRPEWSAVEALAGKPTADALSSVVRNPLAPTASRTAALDILQTLHSTAECIRQLENLTLTPADTWMGDMRWWADQFRALPIGPNETLQVRNLASSGKSELVLRARARYRLLKDAPDFTFSPCYVGILADIDDRTVATSRDQLLADIRTALNAQKHQPRQPAYPKSREDRPDTLDANEKRLSRCDLLTISVLLQRLQNPDLITELHRQGLADLSDTTTEHGGLLLIENNNLIPRPYPPASTSNDLEYATPDKLTRDTVLGIAQYHFHFQQIHNADRAGPGQGDLAYAKAARTNAVVITSIDTRKLNVDYYTPTGAVVDLGTYEAAP